MNYLEREFIMVKPDGVQRGLIGEVITRLERVGLKIVAMKITDKGIKVYPEQEVFGAIES